MKFLPHPPPLGVELMAILPPNPKGGTIKYTRALTFGTLILGLMVFWAGFMVRWASGGAGDALVSGGEPALGLWPRLQPADRRAPPLDQYRPAGRRVGAVWLADRAGPVGGVRGKSRQPSGGAFPSLSSSSGDPRVSEGRPGGPAMPKAICSCKMSAVGVALSRAAGPPRSTPRRAACRRMTKREDQVRRAASPPVTPFRDLIRG